MTIASGQHERLTPRPAGFDQTRASPDVIQLPPAGPNLAQFSIPPKSAHVIGHGMTIEFGGRKNLADATAAERPPIAARSGHASTNSERQTFYRRRGKRFFDAALVLFCAPIWVPLVLILALIVALDGGNPFYSQARVGKGGRIFKMWKLRSMVTGADAMLDSYLASNAAARAEWAVKQKLAKDPRITRFGHFIRKTSLDELPQLWNVLKGDMSLVGPRPMMPEQRSLYAGNAYFALLPGITGPWQTSARSASNFRDRIQYDDAYDQNCSFGLDIKLIWITVLVVLRARGV